MNIKQKLIDINTAVNNSIENQLWQDIMSFQLIRKVYDSGTYIPITEKTLRPYCLAFMINEVMINSRRSIVEFGSGLSTILLGRLFKDEQIEGNILSVEHDQKWINYLAGLVKKEKLGKYIKIIHAPLDDVHKKEEVEFMWFSQAVIDKHIIDLMFDMVIIDGPPAFNDKNFLSRYPALPHIKNRLNKSSVIFIDDANRKGESKTMKYYQREYNLDFQLYGKSLGVAYQGDHFVSNPLNIMPKNI